VKRPIQLVGLVCLALAIAGCSSNDPVVSPTAIATSSANVVAGGSLSVAVVDALPTATWDPTLAPDSTVRTFGPLVMAPLLRPAADGSAPSAGLATSVSSDAAGLNWTVAVRSGLMFADGSTLNSEDIAFGLTQGAAQQSLTGRFGADNQGSFFVSATATDPQTVVVKLRAANALLDRTVFAAPEFGCIQDNYGGKDREAYFRNPVSCGPYVADKSTQSSDELVLRRNSMYYAPTQVGPNTIKVQKLSDSASADSFIAAGGDVVIDPRKANPVNTAVSPSASPNASPSTSASVSPSPSPTPFATSPVGSTTGSLVDSSLPGRVSALLFRSDRPTRDNNVRIAVEASLDIAALVDSQAGAVSPTGGLVPPRWPGAVDVAVPTRDLELAKTAVSLLPKKSRKLSLLVRSGNPDALAQATLVARQAKSAGLTITVKARSTARYAAGLASGNFQLAIVSFSPRVGLAADVTRQWAITGGQGSGWPVTDATTSYGVQLSEPAFGPAADKGSGDFVRVVLDPIHAVALTARTHSALVRQGALTGLVVRIDGSIPLDVVSLSGS
jgi:ABC-type transport system substrate-binding protein